MENYLQLVQLAIQLEGPIEGLIIAIKDHARQNLTDADYIALEAACHEDKIRAARNAGIPLV